VPTTTEIQQWLIQRLADFTHTSPDKIGIREPFSHLGLSSLDIVSLSGELEEYLGRRLSPTLAYDYPDILALAEHLSGQTEKQEDSTAMPAGKNPEPIAVIGMSCRFPGASSPAAYWQMLSEGKDMIREVPADRWNWHSVYDPDPWAPGKSVSRWGGFLDHIDQFDASFFGIAPVEAKQMDPQQRLLLELSYEALDDAGQVTSALDGSATGVFIGISVNEYSQLQLNDPARIAGHTGTGSALSISANRISYQFNFRGPSIAIDTACSSSLAAVHLACQSIHNGECGMALAGGVNLVLSPAHSIAFTKGGVLSPDGHCKTFDASANGYVRGEGGGVVVLKRLSGAIADGDPVHAVILGSAIRQDGRTNGLMAPSQEGQEALLREACRAAGVSPGELQYVEAHGTGTLLGDAMEAGALGAVMGAGRTDVPCLIGSVKTNFGHLEAAAGIAGLIKVILSLQHRQIPASLHYHEPNPHIPFPAWHLEVNRSLRPWPATSGRAMAGVSSFGFGGTNVHLILQETAAAAPTSHQDAFIGDAEGNNGNLLVLSAPSPSSLRTMAIDLLNQYSGASMTSLCHATAHRRSSFHCRMAIVAGTAEELRNGLQAFASGTLYPGLITTESLPDRRPGMAFVFSGQGGQWYGMGRSLLQGEPVFRAALEEVDRNMREQFGRSVIEDLMAADSENRLSEIDVIQPAIFAIQVALAALWRSWGVLPDAVLGHSMGEVAAAHVAGILSLQDAVRVICSRSVLLKQLQGQGGMLATALSPDEAKEIIQPYGDQISLAVINSPVSTVLSGDTGALDKVMQTLQDRNLFCKRVNVDVASHSPQINALREDLQLAMEDLHVKKPGMPIYSSVTGGRADNLDFDAKYWVDNICQPVLFSSAVMALKDDGYEIFIEIGPHPLLLTPIQQTLSTREHELLLLPSMRRDEPERMTLLATMGTLYTRGRQINWKNFFGNKGKYIPLPLIPWQRQRFWIDQPSVEIRYNNQSTSGYHPLLGQRIEIAQTPDTSLWMNVIDVNTLPLLADHRINGDIVFPATAYVEMALQAAAETGKGEATRLTDFRINASMLLIPDVPQELQSQLSPQEEGRFLFNIYSRRKQQDQWVLHASAVMEKSSAASVARDTMPAFAAQREDPSMTADRFYPLLESHGFMYGPAFRHVQGIWTTDGKATGWVQLPADMMHQAGLFQVHPALLDGCLQVIAAAQPAQTQQSLFLPTGFHGMQWFGKPGTALWSQVRLRSSDNHHSGNLVADIRIYDPEGLPVAELEGLQLQRASRRIRSRDDAKNIWLYYPRWIVSEDTGSMLQPLPTGLHWLVLADDDGLGKAVAAQLSEWGHQCHTVAFPRHLVGSESHDDQLLADFMKQTLQEIPARLHGVVHCWSLSGSDISDPDDHEILARGCNSVLYLMQALAQRLEALPRLWLVSRGAQAVTDGDLISPEPSPLWGLGKTIGFEFPESRCTRIDLDPGEPSAESAHRLTRQLSIDDKEDQLAFRSGKRYLPRLAPFQPSGTGHTQPTTFRAHASYLITGGLGGLGLQTAAWMTRKGARHLVLMARSAPTSGALEAVERMRQDGATVMLATADVSDPVQLQKVLNDINTTMPPLRGVIHAAGLLDDGALLNLDAERMRRVMAPKVAGTRNLHLATAKCPLDFFVCYSSAVSVLGAPGQGNYAAASAYQDAMAYYRHQQGLPAVSINWGPWADVGLAAAASERLSEQNAFTQHLIKVIEIDRGLEILELLLAEHTPQILVLPFDLCNLIELYPAAAGMPFLEAVGGQESHVARLYARPNLRQAYAAPRNEFEERLAALWKQTLHIDRVGIHDSFFELGGDSVLAAQLLSMAQQQFGIRLDPQDAFKTFTIERLAAMLEAAIRSKIDAMSENEVMEQLSKENK
jgi:myxalamid-type polyketide synthase MxaE and MxaD